MDFLGSKLRVLYDFEYETRDKIKISISRGEKLFLINKTNDDWWQVIKNSSERPFFVPAPYVQTCDSSEESHVDNPIYGKPSDLRLKCDSVQSEKYLNASLKKLHPEVQEVVEKDYFLPIAAEENFSTSSIDGNELLFCEDGTAKSNIYSECSGLPNNVSRTAHDENCHATSQCSIHSLPSNDEPKAFDKILSPLPDISDVMKINMAEDDKERFDVNMTKTKNKLAKSSSFKTKSELQKLSRVDQETVVLLPLERRDIVHGNLLTTFAPVNYSKSDIKHNLNDNKILQKPEKENQHSVSVPLVFHNELYNLSNCQDDANKTVDSGNISSESLFIHEEDISDSGTSHKSGLISSAQSRESIQEHSDLLADDTSKEELESSKEELWTTESYDDVPIPDGWRLDYDEESGEQCYINEATQAKWFSSTDGKGRVYFFEENSSVSTWTLPNIVVGNNEEAALESDLLLDTSDLPLRNQDGEKKSRVGKARSLFLTDQKHKETAGKSSSIPRNWLQLYGLDKDVLKYGYMNRTKITENGKKMSKKWASAYVVLTEDALCFYKDLKNSQHSVGLQPELSMQLSGARLEPGDKLSSRKHIFLITSGSLQLLCECESGELASQWRSAIANAIARLNRPAATPVMKITQEKPKTASIGRSKSLQVKNREGTFEEAVSSEEQQMKIRDRLKKFFNRRPTREILASKGIYKDEPVFDSHLEKVCPSHPPYIPDFVRLCVAAIESKEENMKTDGLYRASGNLSHVQKIRLQVDQNNLSVLEMEEDVHVLTGALKLFFRELKEPLIPFELFNEAIDAGGMNGSKKEKTKMFREIVKKLPPQNHDTLKFLLRHLTRVTQFEEFNRMHVPNLAIVFGPTLMWRAKEYHQNMAIEYMQQNLVIEFFLQQFDEIFR